MKFKLSPWISYHILLPHLLVLHLILSASFQLCAVSTSWFLPLDSPQTHTCPGMTCFDLAPLLDWTWALGCSLWLIPSLGSHLLLHSKPMYCCSQFNLLWLLALALPSPSWVALHPGTDLDSPLVPCFLHQPLFTPTEPTSLLFLQPSVWAWSGQILEVLVVNLGVVGKWASSVWFSWVESSPEIGQLWQRPWQTSGSFGKRVRWGKMQEFGSVGYTSMQIT